MCTNALGRLRDTGEGEGEGRIRGRRRWRWELRLRSKTGWLGTAYLITAPRGKSAGENWAVIGCCGQDWDAKRGP
jgi:hypothetical protein